MLRTTLFIALLTVTTLAFGSPSSCSSPITNLNCGLGTQGNMELDWTNGSDSYDEIQIFVDGALRYTLPGWVTQISECVNCPLQPGNDISVVAVCNGSSLPGVDCQLNPPACAPITDVTCGLGPQGNMEVSWTNGATYDAIEVLVDGVLRYNLSGSTTQLSECVNCPYQPGNVVTLVPICNGTPLAAVDCEVIPPCGPITNLNCSTWGIAAVDAFWENDGTYDSIEVRLNGQLWDTLPGNFTGFNCSACPSDGDVTVTPICNGVALESTTCSLAGSATFSATVVDIVEETPGLVPVALDSTTDISGFTLALQLDGATAELDAVYMRQLPTGPLAPDFAQWTDHGGGMYTLITVISFIGLDHIPSGLTEVAVLEVTPLAGSTEVRIQTAPVPAPAPLPPQETLAVTVTGQSLPTTGFDVVLPVVPDGFVRGDADGDGSLNAADAIKILNVLTGAAPTDCLDALDVNDDGSFNIGDPIYLLFHLFNQGPPPAPPFGEPGTDPTPDSLDCESLS